MIEKLTKLAVFLEKKECDDEAGSVYEIIMSPDAVPTFLEDVKVAASYPGNMGVMEMFQFQREATPAQKKVMDRLLDENRTDEAWDMLKQTTGVDLFDPPDYTRSQSRKVIETIGRVKIYRDYDTDEYVVLPTDGTEAEEYFTDDLEDAVDTAKMMDKESE
tara:strand:- start:86 stop:568 length:483 start_codon:yes stop_codon:yes gene_type:complete